MSTSKKRPHPEGGFIDFEEMEKLFLPPLDDRFNEVIKGHHSDKHKDPLTKKRAPLYAEIIEELEQIRLNYKGKKDEINALKSGKTTE